MRVSLVVGAGLFTTKRREREKWGSIIGKKIVNWELEGVAVVMLSHRLVSCFGGHKWTVVVFR